MSNPVIIQGGMGVAVSNWRLARAVSRLGGLGVVSGTLLAVVLARRLADGDPNGDMRRALAALPLRGVAERVMADHYIPGGKPAAEAYRPIPMPAVQSGAALTELTIAANFVEVYLAKEGHQGQVGINLLEKVQLTTLPSLYGAMLANVDYVLMGAGIPRAIPGVLDQFAAGNSALLKIDVEGPNAGEDIVSTLDADRLWDGKAPPLKRPRFLAIVSSSTLALTLAKKSSGRIDGFVIESHIAGGHNAPPRGTQQLDGAGEPIYGPRDIPDLAKFREIGLPFWLAGAQATPTKLAEAQQQGAVGIQVGTPFAFCEESGITDALKAAAIQASCAGTARAFTDPSASPTGMPFKVLPLPGTVSQPETYAARERICDLGYLRQVLRRPDGTLGYRCAAEPVDDYVRKGGKEADTVGRKCLCNALAATVGLGQVRNGIAEPPLVTAGNDVAELRRFVTAGGVRYTAADVMASLLGKTAPTA